MRVRSLAPGLAAAGVLAASGCGSDGTATVTVTTGATGTAVADAATPGSTATRTAPGPSRTTPAPPVTTTVVRTTTRTTRTAAPVARTVTATTPRPTTTAIPAAAPDPVGGTVPSSGRVRGNGYSVQVPKGWFDGSRRFEGDRNAFDLNFVKRPGADPVSVIFTDRSRPDGIAGRSVDEVAADLRRDVLEKSPEARVTRGPDLRVDGEDAASFVVRRILGGKRPIRQRQIAVLRGPVLVTIRLTSPVGDFADDTRVLNRFVDSWRWD